MSLSLAIATPVIITSTRDFQKASSHAFSDAVLNAIETSASHRSNLAWRNEGYDEFDCWLLGNYEAGYALSKTASHINGSLELINVFSTVCGAGNGTKIMQHAKMHSHKIHLDCYEGPLVRFYQSHQFKETIRTPDWHGGPRNVVYMRYEK